MSRTNAVTVMNGVRVLPAPDRRRVSARLVTFRDRDTSHFAPRVNYIAEQIRRSST